MFSEDFTLRDRLMTFVGLAFGFPLFCLVGLWTIVAWWGRCKFVETPLPVPEQLAKGELVVIRGARIAVGRNVNGHSCLKNFGKIERELLGPDAFSRSTAGPEYYTDAGLTLEPLALGKRFRLTGIVVVTQHGILGLVVGRSPLYCLILEDADGVLHQVCTLYLGHYRGGFLAYVDPSHPQEETLLTEDSFERGTEDDREAIQLRFTPRPRRPRRPGPGRPGRRLGRPPGGTRGSLPE